MMMFAIVHAIWLVYPIFRHTQDFFIEPSRRDVLDRRSSTASRYSVTPRFALDSGRLSKPKQGDAWSSSGGCPTIFQGSLYMYIYSTVHIYIYVCMYVWLCMYDYVCMYVYIYISIYVYINIYIYIIYMGNGESPTCTSINRHMEPQNCRIKQENQLPEPIFQVPREV